jgi:tetratricopeptide (TPR) repeat protein
MKKLVSLAALVVLSSSAFAGNKDKADALFKQGKKLMAEKRYADACPQFEQSMKLDPGIGTQLNIARCYEEWGRIGHALLAYQAAEKMAKDANDKRVPQIHELVENLDSQVPRLTIRLPKDSKPEGVKVTLDGAAVESIGTALVIDPGPHTIEYTVDDGPKKSKIVPVERGGDSEVTLDVPKDRVAKGGKGGKGGKGEGENKGDGEKKGNGAGKAEETAAAPGRNMRIGGLVLGGAGVIAIGVSSIMTLSARGQYNDALNMYCMGMKDMCDPMGLELTHDARSTANTATIVFLVGTAAVGGGVALYLLAPKGAASAKAESGEQSARYIVPSVSKDGAGVVFGGQF